MPMYELRREEQGTRYRTYRILAESESDAVERIFEEELPPQDEFFKQHDANTFTRQLKDCDCDICERRGPWACMIDENE